MRKEIAEQPDAIRRTLGGRLEPRFQTTRLGGLEDAARELLDVRRVKILGCGSAHIAGSMGAQLIEQLARIPAHAEPASEFRYRNPVIEPDTLYVAVSQSGETFDTLAAVQEVKRKGGRVLGIVNVVGSTHRARMRPRHLPACGPGDRGRRDQDVHVHGGRVRAARHPLGPLARPVDGERRAAASPRSKRCPRKCKQILDSEAAIAAVARAIRGEPRRLFRRPRRRPRRRARGRVEAEGSELSARGGLSGVRAQARAARSDRRGHADGRRAAARRPVREESLDDRGDSRARRPDLRRHASRPRCRPASKASSKCRNPSPSSTRCC